MVVPLFAPNFTTFMAMGPTTEGLQQCDLFLAQNQCFKKVNLHIYMYTYILTYIYVYLYDMKVAKNDKLDKA